jgi:hypothetical protein
MLRPTAPLRSDSEFVYGRKNGTSDRDLLAGGAAKVIELSELGTPSTPGLCGKPETWPETALCEASDWDSVRIVGYLEATFGRSSTPAK